MNRNMLKGRGREIAKVFFNGVLDGAPFLVIFIMIAIVIFAILALLIADILTGQITSNYMFRDPSYGFWVSMATTGLLTCFIALAVKARKDKWPITWIIGFGLMAVSIQTLDIYFDSLSVDIKRFGAIIAVADQLSHPETTAHILFRALVGIISLVGEPMATVGIFTFPIMKELLNSMLKDVRASINEEIPRRQATQTAYQASKSVQPFVVTRNKPIDTTSLPANRYRPVPKPRPVESASFYTSPVSNSTYHQIRSVNASEAEQLLKRIANGEIEQ